MSVSTTAKKSGIKLVSIEKGMLKVNEFSIGSVDALPIGDSAEGHMFRLPVRNSFVLDMRVCKLEKNEVRDIRVFTTSDGFAELVDSPHVRAVTAHAFRRLSASDEKHVVERVVTAYRSSDGAALYELETGERLLSVGGREPLPMEQLLPFRLRDVQARGHSDSGEEGPPSADAGDKCVSR